MDFCHYNAEISIEIIIFFQDKNGIIDKNELRDLFVDIYPNFNK